MLIRLLCRFVLVITASVQPFLGEALSAENITLLEAYEMARESAPGLGVARFKVDLAEAERDIARGQILPSLSAFGQWSENEVEFHAGDSSGYGFQEYAGKRYGWQVKQSLINVSNWREYRRRSAMFSRSEDDLANAELQLLGAVTEAYLNVLVATLDAEVLEQELAALVRQEEESQALYEVRFLPVTQVLETKSRRDSVKADLLHAQGQADIAREQLIELIGVRGVEPFPVSETVNLQAQISSAVEAAQRALENSPEIAAAEDGVTAAREAVERERGGWLPEVDLLIGSQYSDVGFDNLVAPPRTAESVQISVNYPIFEGGAGVARLRAARAEFNGAMLELEDAKRKAESRARSAWANYNAATERVAAAKQAESTAEISLQASRKALKAGTARVTDVLLALAQRTGAQRDHGAARFQRSIAWLELELTAGENPMDLAVLLSAALTATNAAALASQ